MKPRTASLDSIGPLTLPPPMNGSAGQPSRLPGEADRDFDRDPARVLFVWDHLGYPNGATHGLTRYCLDVLPRLNTGSVKLTACFLREAHPAGEELRRAGIEPIFLGRRKWDPRALFDVLRLIRRHDIEIVHALGQKGILAGRTAGRIAGCGVIIHLGDIFRLNPVIHALLRAGAPWTDVAQGVSRAVCDYAIREYSIPPERVELLYNGVPLDQFTRPEPAEVERWRRSMRIAPGAPLIGVVGRLAPEKGHARLLRQMHRVLAQLPDARLLVVGDGPLRDRLEALTAGLGLGDAVRFLGQRDDVPTIMAALDVLAVPSDHEGFSFVALEALMVGTPVVGTDQGGLPEVLKHGEHGVLFSPADEDTLGDRLLWVLRHPAEAARLTQSAHGHLQLFRMETHVRRQREIYLRLARTVRGRRGARGGTHPDPVPTR
jgi:glycosyltransferase involved in cell wall biosynthesis